MNIGRSSKRPGIYSHWHVKSSMPDFPQRQNKFSPEINVMKKIASLSLDLDNQWSYMKTHGDKGWEEYPSYLEIVVPRILKFLGDRGIKITFFIVGKDADLERNHAAIRSIAEAGHEIGNHSYNHEPWLHLYSYEKLNQELERSEESIKNVTGIQTIGFRGPGYSLSQNTLRVLAKRGYSYDATVFPNILNPLARAYMFRNSRLTEKEKEMRKTLFGTFDDAFRPVKPFNWKIDNETLLEVPVTTMPIFKIPIHLSYIIYLSTYSSRLARLYLAFALGMCRLTNTSPSILLHPLDFLDKDDCKELSFFPGMELPLLKKLELIDYMLDMLSKRHRIVTMNEHAHHAGSEKPLPIRMPDFKVAH